MERKYFVYAFDEDTRDKIIELGYRLFMSDETNSRYVFENKNEPNLIFEDLPVVFSNTLVF